MHKAVSEAGYGLQDFQDYILTVLDLNEEYEGTGKGNSLFRAFFFSVLWFPKFGDFSKSCSIFPQIHQMSNFQFFLFCHVAKILQK